MAKIVVKSEKLTPFGGIFPIMEHFDALLSQAIGSTLGLRCKSSGCQYSEIVSGSCGLHGLFLSVFCAGAGKLYRRSGRQKRAKIKKLLVSQQITFLP